MLFFIFKLALATVLCLYCIRAIGLSLLAAISYKRHVNLAVPEKLPFIAIIVPAHNEESILPATLQAIENCTYPPEKRCVYVVADNCTDATAEKARQAGVICLERHNLEKIGKGYALAYALENVDKTYDAVLFLDADSTPEPNYLMAMAGHLEHGEQVIQGSYEVADPERTWFTRMSAASFALRNKWVFPACNVLGISVPLRGSGMCFTKKSLETLGGWQCFGLTEDLEMTLRVLRANLTVHFAATAKCLQYMPAQPAQAVSQRIRWSAGSGHMRSTILYNYLPEYLSHWHWKNTVTCAFLLSPPLSAHLGLSLLLVLSSLFAGKSLLILASLLVIWQIAYILLGFGKMDKDTMQAFIRMPAYAFWRIAVSIKAKLQRPGSWERTTRDGDAPDGLHIIMLGTRGVPASYGGFETCVEEVGSRLAAKGHHVTVYCRSYMYRDRPAIYKDMHLVYLPCIRIKGVETLIHTFLSALHALFSPADVFLVFNAANALSVIPLRLKKAPICINTDGLEWKRAKWGNGAKKFYKFSERLSCTVAHRLITDSLGMHDYYKETYQRPSTTIAYGAYIQNSFTPSLLDQYGLKPRNYFLQVTRFEPENNPLLTAKAFLAMNTDKKLVLIGGAGYAGPYQKALEALKSERILMPGFIYDQDILRELGTNCHAYIHGNEVGGTNPALLQAMAYGGFVMARDVAFNREVLKDAGIYFLPDMKALVDSMQWSLDHEEELEGYRSKAVKIIKERYTWDDIALKYEILCLAAAQKTGTWPE